MVVHRYEYVFYSINQRYLKKQQTFLKIQKKIENQSTLRRGSEREPISKGEGDGKRIWENDGKKGEWEREGESARGGDERRRE